jgi:hypothetical protein
MMERRGGGVRRRGSTLLLCDPHFLLARLRQRQWNRGAEQQLAANLVGQERVTCAAASGYGGVAYRATPGDRRSRRARVRVGDGRRAQLRQRLHRVLRPALVKAELAVRVGEAKVRKRDGTEGSRPVWDYQSLAFHAFRKACGSLLLARSKSPKQVQGWLRHSQLTTTMNVYIHQVDDGLGSADAWDEILVAPANERVGTRARRVPGATSARSRTSTGPFSYQRAARRSGAAQEGSECLSSS